MAEETFETFSKLAIETFGDKVCVLPISMNEEQLAELNKHYHSQATVEDFKTYQAVWLRDTKCLKCGTELLGLFGSFEWGLVHGIGTCSECHEANYRYYHYIGPQGASVRIEHLALAGF